MTNFDNYELELYSTTAFRITNENRTKEFFNDPGRVYLENPFGFRSADFGPPVDLVFAGCSFTYGSGVPAESIWGNLISRSLNLSAVNISKTGASVSWIVDSLFKYFKNYGNPKYLLCLFPDFYRYRFPVDGSHYGIKQKLDIHNEMFKAQILTKAIEPFTIGEKNNYMTTLHINQYKKPAKYIKFPYDYENAISTDLSIYEAIRSIRHLEAYCKSANIKIVWSSWDKSFYDLGERLNQDENLKFDGFFNFMKNNFNTFTKTNVNGRSKNCFYPEDMSPEKACTPWHTSETCSCELNCHQEHVDFEPESFDFGTDDKNDVPGHPGRHWHIHCAESFLTELKNIGVIKEAFIEPLKVSEPCGLEDTVPWDKLK